MQSKNVLVEDRVVTPKVASEEPPESFGVNDGYFWSEVSIFLVLVIGFYLFFTSFDAKKFFRLK